MLAGHGQSHTSIPLYNDYVCVRDHKVSIFSNADEGADDVDFAAARKPAYNNSAVGQRNEG